MVGYNKLCYILDECSEGSVEEVPADHPTGIVLTRSGYYTIPTLDDLTSSLTPTGDCYVQGFTIGREGYGSVYFPDEMNVAKLNLDEIGKPPH